MGSGKGAQQQQQQPTAMTSNVNQSNLPEYARPYFDSLLQRAQLVSNDPYQAFTGQRVADLSPQQQQGISGVTSNIGSYQPGFSQASQNFQQAGQYDPTQVTNSYTANGYTPQNWIDPGVASQYMSPYQQNVTDINKREAFRDFGIQQAQRDGAAEQGGAFGGYRHGLIQAEANRDLNQNLYDIQDRGLQNAYASGLGAFNQDRSSMIGANQLNQGYAQQQAQLGMAAQQANNQFGLQNAQLQAGLGQSQMALGQATQQAGLSDAQSLLSAGAIQQANTQQGLDVGYQNFVDQRDYNRQNLNWLSGILRGVPVTANTSTTGYQAAPNTISQLTGLGLGAAGLSKMLG